MRQVLRLQFWLSTTTNIQHFTDARQIPVCQLSWSPKSTVDHFDLWQALRWSPSESCPFKSKAVTEVRDEIIQPPPTPSSCYTSCFTSSSPFCVSLQVLHNDRLQTKAEVTLNSLFYSQIGLFIRVISNLKYWIFYLQIGLMDVKWQCHSCDFVLWFCVTEFLNVQYCIEGEELLLSLRIILPIWIRTFTAHNVI